MVSKDIIIECEELRKLTEAKYVKIGNIYCPAFKANVYFTSDGFHHLRYDSIRNERDKKVQKNKFKFFDSGVETIKKSTTIQEYRRKYECIGKPDRNGLRKTQLVHYFGFFSILSFSKSIRVKAVVRRIGEGGQYHFWSVMPFWTLSNHINVIGSKDIEDG